MKCPICNVDFQMTERQGIEIDYCPQCRGVWLDRGESLGELPGEGVDVYLKQVVSDAEHY